MSKEKKESLHEIAKISATLEKLHLVRHIIETITPSESDFESDLHNIYKKLDEIALDEISLLDALIEENSETS